MATKIPIHSARMLLLMKHLVDTEQCPDNATFLDSIDFERTNISHIKTGRQKFTVAQLTAACAKYKVNMNWLVGLESEMIRTKSRSAMMNLKEAVRVLEAEIGLKSTAGK